MSIDPMKLAALLFDPTDAGGTILGPGVPNVIIEGMPAIVVGDQGMVPGSPPPTGPFPTGGGKVQIGGKHVIRKGDTCSVGGKSVKGATKTEIG